MGRHAPLFNGFIWACVSLTFFLSRADSDDGRHHSSLSFWLFCMFTKHHSSQPASKLGHMPTFPIHWLPHLAISWIDIFEVCWFKKWSKLPILFNCVDFLWRQPRHERLLALVFLLSVEHLSKVMLAFREESNSNETLYKCQEFNA